MPIIWVANNRSDSLPIICFSRSVFFPSKFILQAWAEEAGDNLIKSHQATVNLRPRKNQPNQNSGPL